MRLILRPEYKGGGGGVLEGVVVLINSGSENSVQYMINYNDNLNENET